MKKRLTAIVALILAAVFLVACQATPEKEVVVQKDMKQMIEKAQGTAAPGSDVPDLWQMNIPDTLNEELISTKGKLKVQVNADIILPDTDAIPTVYVGMGSFSQEDVMRLYETLCGGAMPVDPYDTQITQAYKMRIVQGLLDQKKSGKLDKYTSMEELDAAIQEAMAEAGGLPEHFERTEPDFSFSPSPLGSGSIVNLRVAPDDATLSELFIINAEEGMGQSRAEYYRDQYYRAPLSVILASGVDYSDKEVSSPYFVPPQMSEEDARTLAEETAAKLGLEDFICSGSRVDMLHNISTDAEDAPRQGIYEFMFTRQIGGVTITYTGDDGNIINDISGKVGVISGEKANDFYFKPWMYEKVRIFIDDEGVLCLLWNSPYVVSDTVTENTALLPFEDIHNTFEQMITVAHNTYDTSEENITCYMYITEARLGLMRVTEKDIGIKGLVVPVWDFFGYYEDSEGIVYGRNGYCSMLTINAIDGSIIDRGFGY